MVNSVKWTELQMLAQVIEDLLFVRGPEGSHQIPFGSVAGEPVDYHMGRYFRKAQLEPLCVFLQIQTFTFSCPVVGLQVGTPQHMEQMEFDPVGAGVYCLAGGLGSHLRGLPRQA